MKGGLEGKAGEMYLPLKDIDQRTRRPSKNSTKKEICVTFEFPDGSITESIFQLGQTVEVLKAYLAVEFGIDMADIDLEFADRLMLDPLSLNDFPFDPTDGFDVRVITDGDNWTRESKCK